MRSVFGNSPPPKPEVILTNFFAEPTVLLVPITSRELVSFIQDLAKSSDKNIQTDLIIINFAKAFDKVSHKHLRYKIFSSEGRPHLRYAA